MLANLKFSVVSTITAKKFYERNGFVKSSEPEYIGSILGDFPLIKHLSALVCFSNQFLEKNYSSLTESQEKTPPKSLVGLRRHFAAQCAFKSEAECFRNIKAPTLFIAGEEDWICPPADVKKFADLIPDSQIVVFPEAGHLLSLEHPDKFAQVLCDFLVESHT